MFRPEVVWSKGKISDILFGDTHASSVRCASIAEHATLAAIMMMNANADRAWDECVKGLVNCKSMARRLVAAI
jgi:hypothetical protein